MIRIKQILVPVDFSEPSKKAVNYGLSLCLEFKSRLVLTHIAPYDALAYLTAKTSLLELIPADYREKIDFEIIVKSGDVRQELLGIVEDKDIDLVVMGSRGRSYFERVLLGSMTDYVAEVRAQAAERLSELVALVSDGRVPTTTVLADGVPCDAIIDLTIKQNVDLVIIDLHERGRLKRALLGATAERVIRTAAVPVLSLPMPANYFPHWAAA